MKISRASELDSQFGISGSVRVCEGNGKLPRVLVTHSKMQGEVYLYGAQVMSWKPAGHDELLFVSSQSSWREGQAIRGGIPICFPWFRAKKDAADAPAHGFARTKMWRLESIVENEGEIVIKMFIESDEQTQHLWDAKFRLTYRVVFGSELNLELTCTNTGATAFHFEEALHTYNRVGDIQQVRIQGLDRTHFLDNTDANKQKSQLGDVIISSQTDKAYIDTLHTVDLIDIELKRRIRLQKTNSRNTVVWNPWREGAAKLPDLGGNEWTQFVCVEASNILDAQITVEPGQEHKITAVISVAKL